MGRDMIRNDMTTSAPNPVFLAEKAWDLYQSHGVPIEVSEQILQSYGLTMDTSHLASLMQHHQTLSQQQSAGQFKSGLGEDTTKTRRLHSVTHILHQVLRDMFGDSLRQTGSAITTEKARFDVTLSTALTPEQIAEVERQVQAIIDKHIPMKREQMSQETARALGAIGLFGEKYGDVVTIYTMQDVDGRVYTREFCNGPHISNTAEIGKFKILKQKSVGQGIRRIEYDVE